MANERQGVKPSARIKAILDELDRVAAEYAEAQREWESACVRFQAARERFAGIKRIASDMLASWPGSRSRGPRSSPSSSSRSGPTAGR